MRLDFNVLWIDDQPANVTGFQDNLRFKALREGFKLHVIHEVSVADAMKHLSDDVFIDNIDLVVVDYDLGAGGKGDDAIRDIRRHVPYKDIVFYSAISTANLKDLVLKKGIEGVFCAHREQLGDRLSGVFEALVKKVLDIDHTRGIVMGVTSDIDHIVNECLLELESKLTDEHKIEINKYITTKMKSGLTESEKVLAEFTLNQSIIELLQKHRVFTAAHKMSLLKKIVKLTLAEYADEYDGVLGQYINDVQPKRNKLGHVKIVAEGSRRSLKGHGEIEFSAGELRSFRQELIEYRDKFESLAKIVGLQIE